MKTLIINQYTALVSLVLLIICPSISFAQINSQLLEFALSGKNQSTNLTFSTNTYKTKTNQLSIHWYEPFTHYFHAGLEFGYLDMTQIDNTPASAQFTSGEFAGLLLRFIPLATDTLTVSLNLNYRYNQTSGESTTQETQFSWNETAFVTEFQYQVTQNIGLLAAAEFYSLNGEQRDSGTINKITEFKESEQQAARFGVNFSSNRSGVIGIEWMTGFNSGTRLYFLRKF